MKVIIMLLIASFASLAAFAQTDKSKTDTAKSSAAKPAKYTCPMHSYVVSDKPGKCPDCGMNLAKVKTYTCPMHPEVVSNKPGKCPKCEMDLVEVKPSGKLKKE